ncbi:hypothetical protein AVL48_25310 [Amycolatopsis regifaucium]|uniref:Uncharacterized protein n=1 Tax=Amycolatopsis regifaucium TaxID=546365 RepID=A0A154MSJ4_9PSEU|nr:hypothetical protein AVL48_25310 [Amycolatopsis regifaucium]OKA09383.1 hypothetical protein ATP06_0207865 [Amycolatopsis regifaucium]
MERTLFRYLLGACVFGGVKYMMASFLALGARKEAIMYWEGVKVEFPRLSLGKAAVMRRRCV